LRASSLRSAYTSATARVGDLTLGAGDPAIKALVTSALDAARAAGATYADVRHMTTLEEGWGDALYATPYLTLGGGIGVRALYNGYWGYAALTGSQFDSDAVARLGREATAQAKTGAKGPARVVDLAPTPVVRDGIWTTPIEIDPFSVPWDEKNDVVNGFRRYFGMQPFGAFTVSNKMRFEKKVHTFGSSEGSFITQTLYQTRFTFPVVVGANWRTGRAGARTSDEIASMAGAGWEYVLNAPFEAESDRLIAQANDATSAAPLEVGRYDIVFDGTAMARIADITLGTATELDRAMGYTANTVGTSYINDPLAMVGQYVAGSPLVTVHANRSMPGGAATVQWDDEGVEPDDVTLVKDGVLMDFQTTRESAGWLAPYYAKRGTAVRSHGGMFCQEIIAGPTQGAHNLVVAPSSQENTFAALCAGVKKGLAVLSGGGRTDQQALNSEGGGELVYDIVNGKLGRVRSGAVLLTRSPEFWKNVIGVGGASTVSSVGSGDRPRPPAWEMPHTVSAPAALVKQVAVTTNVIRSL
jgi:TldD protein